MMARTYGYRRRHGLLGWANRHRLPVAMAAAVVILFAYSGMCAFALDRWFPSMVAAYWLAGGSVLACVLLVRVAFWAGR